MGKITIIENYLIEEIQKFFQNQTTLNKKMEDVFYELERYETSIIIKKRRQVFLCIYLRLII